VKSGSSSADQLDAPIRNRLRERKLTMNKMPHAIAIEAALAAEWTRAHEIVQELSDPLACWIHAILHKMEGDAGNSRYWYSQSGGRRYEDFADPGAELKAALAATETA
jgi:hypothetical protein